MNTLELNHHTGTMTLRAAFAYAIGEAYDRATWRSAEKAIVDAGYCPHCACDKHRVKLGRWEPGNYYNNAGRQCPDCEAFVVCGSQPEYEPDQWRGDADSGL